MKDRTHLHLCQANRTGLDYHEASRSPSLCRMPTIMDLLSSSKMTMRVFAMIASRKITSRGGILSCYNDLCPVKRLWDIPRDVPVYPAEGCTDPQLLSLPAELPTRPSTLQHPQWDVIFAFLEQKKNAVCTENKTTKSPSRHGVKDKSQSPRSGTTWAAWRARELPCCVSSDPAEIQ